MLNFFSLREKVTKRGKNPNGLSLGRFGEELKVLSPPRVEILLRTLQNLLGTTANFYDMQTFRFLQNGE
jgi:hypothetical protein